ncbi:hypothetical protein OOJ96_21855 [Pseudomonas sp. 15FMM2]|uniref:Uncharacterized protein n=1 Tax=Pseudomonas imrae TaxID=2992837 RepID=A0ACC7PL81_9PSED
MASKIDVYIPGTKKTLEPTEPRVPAPEVTTPVSGGTYAKSVDFEGTGYVGWSVSFYVIPTDGHPIGQASVDAQGHWKFSVEMNPGTHEVFGVQRNNRETSNWTPFIEFNVT